MTNAPSELVSVEAMIGDSAAREINHRSTETSLAGTRNNRGNCSVSGNQTLHRHEVGGGEKVFD